MTFLPALTGKVVKERSTRVYSKTTYERSKGVPVCEAPIVWAKLVIGTLLERAVAIPALPIGPPPNAHVVPLLTAWAQSVFLVAYNDCQI